MKHAGAVGALVGLYEIVEFTKITKDSSKLQDNNLQVNRLTDSHIFSQYSGISFHSFGCSYSHGCHDNKFPN
jgi:hypothetical protein